MRDNDHAYSELAWLYAGCGLHSEAVKVLETIEARKKESLFPMLYYQLGYLYERVPRWIERAAQCYGKARSAEAWRYVFPSRLEELLVLRRVLQREPQDWQARYALAALLASRYRYQDAIRELRAAASEAASKNGAGPVERPEVLTVLYRNLAFLLWKVEEKTDEAIECYRKALQYGPGHFLCYQELARLYKEQERPEEAIDVLNSGFGQVEDESELALHLAPSYWELGQYDELIRMAPRCRYDAWKGLAMQRWVRRARTEKGKALFKSGDLEGALREFQKATTVCPENIPVMNRLSGELSEVLWWKGQTLEKLGRPQEAIETWARAEKERHEPISPMSFFQARCLQGIGKTARASEILENMLFYGEMYATRYPLSGPRKNDRLGAYLYLQALAHEGLGDTDTATRLYEKVVEMLPEHAQAKERLELEALAK